MFNVQEISISSFAKLIVAFGAIFFVSITFVYETIGANSVRGFFIVV